MYIKREDAERAMLDNCDIEFLEEYRIDRQKDDFCEIQPYYEAVLNYQQSLSAVPSADVVRCKDCKWGNTLKEFDSGYCENKRGLQSYITATDYCGYGEM